MRRKQGRTLQELAQLAELDKAHLSRIERGERSASIATLMRLARALDISLGSLLGEKTEGDEIQIFRNITQRPADKGVRVGSSQFLAVASKADALGVFMLFPSPEFNREGPASHPGSEFLFVIKGRIEIRFADHDVELSQGDCLLFPGHLPHFVRRRSASAVVLILISRE